MAFLTRSLNETTFVANSMRIQFQVRALVLIVRVLQGIIG